MATHTVLTYAVARNDAEAVYCINALGADFVVWVLMVDPTIHDCSVIFPSKRPDPKIPIPGKFIAMKPFSMRNIRYSKWSWEAKDPKNWDLRLILGSHDGFRRIN